MENGLTEDKINQLDTPENDFSARERLALEYAEKLAVDHHNIDDGFFERLRTSFDDAEILELGMMIGQYIGFGRLLKVLDLEPKFCPTDDLPEGA
jgi:alkylhydroperoxidase family enzyme